MITVGIDVGSITTKAAVVQDGNIVTSRGPGTAMDFTLKLIEILIGTETSEQVEQALQRP